MPPINSRLTKHEGFCPGLPAPHQRKYGTDIRFRGRAHEFPENSWSNACREADINMHRPGAFGPAKEPLEVRFRRFSRDLPVEGSRWSACEALGIPRALHRRRKIDRQMHRQKLGGVDPAVMRGKCTSIGKCAWETTKHVSVEQPWSLPASHRRFIMYPPWNEGVAPSHMFKFVEDENDEVGFQMAVHGTIAQAFLAHLQHLPRSWGLTRLQDYDENGVPIPGSETSEGDVPFITIVVPDMRMVPILMYYIYHQNQEALLTRLCGDYAKPLLNNLFLTNQCNEFLDVRIAELRQSEKIAQEVSREILGDRLHDLYSLHGLADFLGLSDDRFWNTLHVAHRVLLDAAGLKEKFETRRNEAEKLRKENEAEEKAVEAMLLEDYLEEMEVEEIVLDGEEYHS